MTTFTAAALADALGEELAETLGVGVGVSVGWGVADADAVGVGVGDPVGTALPGRGVAQALSERASRIPLATAVTRRASEAEGFTSSG